MRFMKKLMATVCSLAMVATIASSMVVYAANGNPTFTLVKTEAASGIEGAYDISVRLDVTRDSEYASYGAEFNNLLNFTVWLKLDGTFDTTSSSSPAYATKLGPVTKYNNVATWNGFGTVTVNYDNGYIKVVRGDVNVAKAITAETDLVTFKNVKLADDVTTEDFEVSLDYALCGIGYDASYQDSYKYVGDTGEAVGSSTALLASDIATVTFPGNKTDDGDDEGDDTPTITKVGSFADGANDNAVAYMYETTAVAGNTVTATGTITFADDTTKTATLSKAVNANVEGAVALGIIVQFDGTWKDFVITEMAIN